jgi:Lon protease-like protein
MSIGLFPLGIVLFPESAIPLHIFEERYKKLIRHSLDGKITFGINYISASKVYDIGCIARVSEVIKTYSDGKMDILVHGLKRFKMNSFYESSHGYFIAETEDYEDKNEEIDYDLLESCIFYYNQITETITSVKIDKLDMASFSHHYPSFFIAQKSGLASQMKQELLEMRTENNRLDALQKHLNSILPKLKESEYIAQIIKNDGYYTPEMFK